MQRIQTIESAYRNILDKLVYRGFIIKFVIPINQGRYILVKGEQENILIMYKRDFFHNFGYQFRSLGYSGVGDSINVSDLKECLRKNVNKIYTVFPNGCVYSITISKIMEKSERWVNKEGREVRSFSIHEYSKEFEL